MADENQQSKQAWVKPISPFSKIPRWGWWLILGLTFSATLGAGAQAWIQQRRANIETNFPAHQESMAGWQTYRNEEYGFEFKYPAELATDLKNIGFMGGSDYYGRRDFNILITNSKIEPSVPLPTGDVTPTPKYGYDGYNFAIFSGDSATKQLSSFLDVVKIGNKFSPALEKESVDVSGQKYQLYFIPPSNLPNTDKTSYWFTSFPIKNSTVIVTGNYDRMVLHQILSTFKFISPSPADSIKLETLNEEWNLYTNVAQGYSLRIPKRDKNGAISILENQNITYITIKDSSEYLHAQSLVSSEGNEVEKSNISWAILSKPISSRTGLDEFIKMKFGLGCGLILEKSKESLDVYDVVLDGITDPGGACGINYAVAIKYSPKLKKVVTWSLGQGYHFFLASDPSKGVDGLMVDSFRFSSN